jgi:hypothetical protein
VRFVSELHPEALRSLGPQLENHAMFPNRTNVQLARVRSRSAIDVLYGARRGRDARLRLVGLRGRGRSAPARPVDRQSTTHAGGACAWIGADCCRPVLTPRSA